MITHMEGSHVRISLNDIHHYYGTRVHLKLRVELKHVIYQLEERSEDPSGTLKSRN